MSERDSRLVPVSASLGSPGRDDSFSERDPVSPLPLGGGLSSNLPLSPRVLLLDGVVLSSPRVLGEAVGRVLPAVERGVAAGVPRGVVEACAPGEAVAPDEAGPAGVALASALAAPVVVPAPVVVVAPVVAVAPVVVVEPVVVLPETSTPTAAPGLTP